MSGVDPRVLLIVAVLVLGPVRCSQDGDGQADGEQAGKAATGVLPQFSAWLRKHGVDDGAVRLVAEDGSGWGNGIIARRPLKEGDLLFRIPLKWCLHSVGARRNKHLAKLLSQGTLPRGMAGEAIVVALLLMVEACQTGEPSSTCALRTKGPSEWHAYIRALPSNFSAPVFWSTAEFGELKGSQLEEMVASDLTETRQEWSMIQKLIRPHRDVFCDECFNFDTYRWAAWNVHSRALTLRGIKYLIPLADMVNYEPLPDDGAHKRNHQELFLKYHRITLSPHDEGSGTAEIFADRDFAKGRIIVESYGDNPNNMYLRYFGFVPEANPTDCRTLHFSLQQVTQGRDATGAMLKELKLPAQVKHCFRLGEAVPAHVLRFLRVLHARRHEIGGPKTAHDELSARNEKAVFRTLAAQCEKLLAAFPTTLDEDERWLEMTRAHGSNGESSHVNKKHAVLARISEKRILTRLRKNAKRNIKQIKARGQDVTMEDADSGSGEQPLFSSDEL